MTQRETQGHLEEIYGVEISPWLISTVTDEVLDEVRAWQSRPLDSVHPILYLDALQVKVKSGVAGCKHLAACSTVIKLLLSLGVDSTAPAGFSFALSLR